MNNIPNRALRKRYFNFLNFEAIMNNNLFLDFINKKGTP